MASVDSRLVVEVTGLGDDKKLATKSADTTEPVEVFRGYALLSAVPTDDPVQIDIGNISPASLRHMSIVAKAGTVYVSPISSANVTAACVITANGLPLVFNWSTTTNLAWAIAAATTDAIEYIAYGVAT